MESLSPLTAYNTILRSYQSRWVCKVCHRFCKNCCGRSCALCCIHEGDTTKAWPKQKITWYGPVHADGGFMSSDSSVPPYYTVHPEWKTDGLLSHVNPLRPLKRPPWPWEQGRYRTNFQAPFCYTFPEEDYIAPGTKIKEPQKKIKEPHTYSYFFEKELPPISCQLKAMDKSLPPHYIVRY